MCLEKYFDHKKWSHMRKFAEATKKKKKENKTKPNQTKQSGNLRCYKENSFSNSKVF